MKKFLLITILLLQSFAFCAEEKKPLYPKQVEKKYGAKGKRKHLYHVQEPTKIDENTCFLIYMHGAGSKEEQGMWLFPKLREIMAQKNWVYVCPRDYEFDKLIDDLFKRYGKHPVYLAGASLGGKKIYYEARKNPKKYSGLFLLGPAISSAPMPKKNQLTMPIFLIYGEHDGGGTKKSRKLAKTLKKYNSPIMSIEIKGGNHNSPCHNVTWWPKAIAFITKKTADVNPENDK